MKNNKNIVFLFFFSSSMLAGIFFSIIIIFDPLKIFHKPWFYKEYLSSNMREQALGIINNSEFDSIILGTSMLENTSSKETSRMLGGKFINISLSDSDFFERSIVLKYVLKYKRLRTVLYSLDYVGLTSTRQGKRWYRPSKWDYLYDNNPLNDVRVYLNNYYLGCLFSMSSEKKCMGKKYDFDRPRAWYKIKSVTKRFGGIDNWFKAKKDADLKEAFQKILMLRKEL